jgi:uncharacterized coiled-coil protein SlyX
LAESVDKRIEELEERVSRLETELLHLRARVRGSLSAAESLAATATHLDRAQESLGDVTEVLYGRHAVPPPPDEGDE